MSKRGVTFTKPQEPSFLRKLKEEAGYKEGPTVETKKEELQLATREDFEDTEEELPTVVVLQEGDLSAEQVAEIQKQEQKELEETPADLTCPIVFKTPSSKDKPSSTNTSGSTNKRPSASSDTGKQKKKSKKSDNKTLLSFDEEENDD